MLKQLVIQNIAVVESQSIEFEAGLNVITGETGAGKSIIVDALALLRGQKADPALIRSGADTALASAVFETPRSPEILTLLNDLGIPAGAAGHSLDIHIRRIIPRNGRARAFLNDVPVTTKALQDVSKALIDISSQFEHQRLLEADQHTWYLDQFVSAARQAARYAGLHQRLLGTFREIAELARELDLRGRERSLLLHERDQIDALAPDEADYAQVTERVTLGQRAAQARSVCAELGGLVSESEVSLITLASQLRKGFERLQRYAGSVDLGDPAAKVDALSAVIEDLQSTVDDLHSRFDIDEEQLEAANQRLDQYNKLLQKFGPQLSDLLGHRAHAEEFLAGDDSLQTKLEALFTEAQVLVREAIQLGAELTRLRSAGLSALTACIERELAELGMPKSRFVCELVPNGESSTCARNLPPELEKCLPQSELGQLGRLSASGQERAAFLLSANPGMDPRPLEAVASGGELSRIMLAIKSVLFERESTSVFVFDEIDTGISGKVAAMVGRKMAEFCKDRQAICITHLPQVACYAKAHFVASKKVAGNMTRTSIRRAGREEVVQELAKMLSGEEVTQESVAQAKALLAQAEGVPRTPGTKAQAQGSRG